MNIKFQFDKDEDAQRAILAENGSEFQGKKIDVKAAKRKPPPDEKKEEPQHQQQHQQQYNDGGNYNNVGNRSFDRGGHQSGKLNLCNVSIQRGSDKHMCPAFRLRGSVESFNDLLFRPPYNSGHFLSAI